MGEQPECLKNKPDILLCRLCIRPIYRKKWNNGIWGLTFLWKRMGCFIQRTVNFYKYSFIRFTLYLLSVSSWIYIRYILDLFSFLHTTIFSGSIDWGSVFFPFYDSTIPCIGVKLGWLNGAEYLLARCPSRYLCGVRSRLCSLCTQIEKHLFLPRIETVNSWPPCRC